MTPFERGLVAHLLADWLLQNDWMAKNKSSLTHPAAWIHAAIHTACLSLALGLGAGLLLGLVHLLVDTRRPVRWWQKVFGQTSAGPVGQLVAIGVDQTVHLVCVAIVVAFPGLPSGGLWL